MAATPDFDISGFMLGLFLTGAGLWMRLDPTALDGATVSGRHGLVKTILVESWSPTGGLVFLGLGAVLVAWALVKWKRDTRRAEAGAS